MENEQEKAKEMICVSGHKKMEARSHLQLKKVALSKPI